MRIALCDDNEQDLNYYSDLIYTLAKENNIAIEVVRFETGEQALFHISNNEKPIDILLLDIHMPGINGIETGLKLRQAPFRFHGEIVFVTVSSDYAIDAFDVQAFHYIVKGITSTEKTNAILTNALNKAVEKEQEFILLKGIGEYRNIPIQSIYYFAFHLLNQLYLIMIITNNLNSILLSESWKSLFCQRDFYEYIAPILYRFPKLKHLILHH